VDLAVTRRTASRGPAGILVVNVTGSLVLGVVVGLSLYHGVADPTRAVVGTGFVGAYTTFSTFSYDTVRLLEDGRLRQAALNITLSLAGGLAAAATGLWLVAVAWP
ncbi:MAG TPA: fluoride efflux transporter CrcB, partial [Acidimicrobiales bacterium]|nr:fluoride efflux transporter CrcB [Acidimicrobiales bacterium]